MASQACTTGVGHASNVPCLDPLHRRNSCWREWMPSPRCLQEKNSKLMGVSSASCINPNVWRGASTAVPRVSRTRSMVGPRPAVSKATEEARQDSSPMADIGAADMGWDDDEFYEIPVHTVKVHDRVKGVVHEFQVPEDQYILHTGEDYGIDLPFACRHGCCTACAVRVKSGELLQPLALGISPELKAQGYALMCVGVPKSDLEVETQDEDEVYWLQFGRYFAKGPVERDDYALELAVADE
eukprot:TRINITY_DN7150_c0_g1_i1.p1 TRINITY_DN7150_c0_g1~~TRINITY_DN7150_c0_g1_i1.p1  ORF type:complete len:241 (+),score=36.99 TRINITY_DN7150_c0_g1_i1:146-868(+)